MNKRIMLIAILTLVIDQLLKIYIELNITLNHSVTVIKNFFLITYANNYGAAWSLFNNQTILLISASLISLFIIYRFMNIFKDNHRNKLAFGLLYGGITGNLLDRLFLGYVRDFLEFRIFNYNFPVFNISDIAIFVGVGLLIIAIIKGEDNGNKW